jgi:prepilin-type N-terminal cleavage/methylation domain-containing protein
MKDRNQKNKGFTIIELMIVIVIMGVLSGLISLIYKEYKKKSYSSISVAQASDMKKAVEAVMTDSVNSDLFDVEREISYTLEGVATCTEGCAGVDLANIFPGYKHQPGTDIRISIHIGGGYEIVAGHCRSVNDDETQYEGWVLTDAASVVATQFPVADNLSDCTQILSGGIS